MPVTDRDVGEDWKSKTFPGYSESPGAHWVYHDLLASEARRGRTYEAQNDPSTTRNASTGPHFSTENNNKNHTKKIYTNTGPSYYTVVRVPEWAKTKSKYPAKEVTSTAPNFEIRVPQQSSPTLAGGRQGRPVDARDAHGATAPAMSSSAHDTAGMRKGEKGPTWDEVFEAQDSESRWNTLNDKIKKLKPKQQTLRERLGLITDTSVVITPDMISKAYKKFAVKCHPDKVRDGGEKAQTALKIIAELSEAKDGLTELLQHREDQKLCRGRLPS